MNVISSSPAELPWIHIPPLELTESWSILRQRATHIVQCFIDNEGVVITGKEILLSLWMNAQSSMATLIKECRRQLTSKQLWDWKSIHGIKWLGYIYATQEIAEKMIIERKEKRKNTTPKRRKTASPSELVVRLLKTYNWNQIDAYQVMEKIWEESTSIEEVVTIMIQVSDSVEWILYNPHKQVATYYDLELIEAIQNDFKIYDKKLVYKKDTDIDLWEWSLYLLSRLLDPKNNCVIHIHDWETMPATIAQTLNQRFSSLNIPYKITTNIHSRPKKVYFSHIGTEPPKPKRIARPSNSIQLSHMLENQKIDFKDKTLTIELEGRSRKIYPLSKRQALILSYHITSYMRWYKKLTLGSLYTDYTAEKHTQIIEDIRAINSRLNDFGLEKYTIRY